MHIKKEVTDFSRFKQIVNVLFKYEFGYLIHGIKLSHILPFHKKLQKHKFKKNENPKQLRKAFEELGGAFIKLGQMLSIRPDLVPKEYAQEFTKLQDKVGPFAVSKSKSIIKKELGKPVNELFLEFDNKPIAAASVGQVHVARLKSGKQVAVKVKRPGVNKLFHTDIHLLFYLAKLVKKHFPKTLVDPVEIIKQFQKYTIKEMDYIREAKSIDKFFKNFKDDKTTKIPKVYWKYTTNKVLTTELILGTELLNVQNNKTKLNKKKVTRNIVTSFLKQIFVDGFFHADPHPANIFVLKDSSIALVDFGINGFLDEKLKEDSADLFIALIRGDVDMVAESMVNLGFIVEPIDMGSLKEDLVDHLSEYRGTSIKHVDLSDLFHNLLGIAREYKIKFPVNFVLLCKSIVTLESSCEILDPEFNLLETAKPFVKKLEKRKISPKQVFRKTHTYTHKVMRFMRNFPEKSDEFFMEFKSADRTMKSIHRDMGALTKEISRSTINLIFGLIIVSLVIGSAMVHPYSDRLIWGIPLFSFMYLSIASLLLIYIIVFNLHKKKLR
ncbi:MAG: protein kinase UbiB [Candidatus Woesearchaeota archaeon]|nr:protein kinase UbiB [Candidatus Woesearchaeota archaeon]